MEHGGGQADHDRHCGYTGDVPIPHQMGQPAWGYNTAYYTFVNGSLLRMMELFLLSYVVLVVDSFCLHSTLFIRWSVVTDHFLLNNHTLIAKAQNGILSPRSNRLS